MKEKKDSSTKDSSAPSFKPDYLTALKLCEIFAGRAESPMTLKETDIVGLRLLEFRGRAAAEAVNISEESAGILQNGLTLQVNQLLDAAKSRKNSRRASADAKREPKCEGNRRLPNSYPRKLKKRNQSTIPSNGVSNGVVTT